MVATQRFQARDASAPMLSTRAAVLPDSLNEDDRTVTVVWTTGARVERGFFSRFIEELSLNPDHVRMERLQSGASPVLNAHRARDAASVLGVVTSARLEGDRGVATLQFAGDDASDAVFRKVQTGILRNVSVGYRVHKFEQIEGVDDDIPVFRAIDWEPMEISVVPIPADPGAMVREADAMNACQFLVRAEEIMEPKTEVSERTADPVAPEQTKPEPVDVEAIRLAERKRCQEIRRVNDKLGNEPALAERAIEDNLSIDEFRAVALDAYAERQEKTEAPQGRAGDITAGEDEREKWLRGAGDWLMIRAAVQHHHKSAHEHYPDEFPHHPGRLDASGFRGMSLLDLARESLQRAGVKTRGMSRMEVARQALLGRGSVMGAASTSDFPVLLENVLHKTLLGAYAITQDKWRRFCAVSTVMDFRNHNRYRQGTFGRLDKVLESGEFRNKPIPDARKEVIAAETFGNIIAITRQTIINDDMGAFNSLAARLGRAAGLSIEVDIFGLLAENGGLGPNMFSDGLPLYDAAHNNISAGAPLSIAAVDADLVVLASQVDESGNEVLELEPAILLVHRAQESQALNINGSEFNVDDDALGSSKSRVPNVVRGKFRDVVASTRLASTTRRYIFTEPGDTPTLEVAFLDGQQTPILEMQEGFRVDGMEWRVRLDYGVAAVDYRGTVTDAGV